MWMLRTVKLSDELLPRVVLPSTFKFPSTPAFPRAERVVIVILGRFCKPLAFPEVF